MAKVSFDGVGRALTGLEKLQKISLPPPKPAAPFLPRVFALPAAPHPPPLSAGSLGKQRPVLRA
jgi:hypothetical protein